MSVPGRGKVIFDGFGSLPAASAFFMALPLAKPVYDNKHHADGCSAIRDIVVKGTTVTWKWIGWDGQDDVAGSASADGPDAAALAADAKIQVEATIAKVQAERLRWRTETDADED